MLSLSFLLCLLHFSLLPAATGQRSQAYPALQLSLIHISIELYEFTLETIAEQGCIIHENIADIYGKGLATGPLAIQTYYEKMHLAEGRTIYYVCFSLPDHLITVPERFRNIADDAEDVADGEEIAEDNEDTIERG